MDAIERLTRLFERFPGIGPRQAGRFVAYLLRSSPSMRKELVDSIQQLGSGVKQCKSCMRYYAGEGKSCSICANPERDASSIAIVASDSDLVALERSGTYKGKYFVLGGTISLVSDRTSGLRLKEFEATLKERSELEEAILAFPANPEGDATAIRVREEIAALAPALRVTALGRGLSTGSELEYADPETIKSAFESRR